MSRITELKEGLKSAEEKRQQAARDDVLDGQSVLFLQLCKVDRRLVREELRPDIFGDDAE